MTHDDMHNQHKSGNKDSGDKDMVAQNNKHVRDQIGVVNAETVSPGNPSMQNKLNISAGGGPKDSPIAGGKPPFDTNPGPFEQQQDPERPIGEYTREGQPPLMKK